MNKTIQEFIDCKKIAIVGVSRNANKFGNMAYKELKKRGYQVFAVNPSCQEIDGDPCYPNLTALKGQIEGVVITVPPAKGIEVLEEAARLGLTKIWVQQQADSPELVAAGERLGLNLVTKKCILMYAPPVRSFHAWHRAFVRLIGQY